MASSFEQAGAQLMGIAGQQTDLQRAVAAGELWMEAGVAEAAAARCDQTVEDLTQWLNSTDRLTKRCRFGNNEDGWAAAERFAQAGREVVTVVENARTVFQNMAKTYRAAGRTVTTADEVGQQMFQSGSQ